MERGKGLKGVCKGKSKDSELQLVTVHCFIPLSLSELMSQLKNNWNQHNAGGGKIYLGFA